jgi:hypothetical protein
VHITSEYTHKGFTGDHNIKESFQILHALIKVSINQATMKNTWQAIVTYTVFHLHAIFLPAVQCPRVPADEPVSNKLFLAVQPTTTTCGATC